MTKRDVPAPQHVEALQALLSSLERRERTSAVYQEMCREADEKKRPKLDG